MRGRRPRLPPEGKRRRKAIVHSTLAGCVAKLREVRRQVGLNGDVPTRSTTLADWLDRWMVEHAAQRVRQRTLDTYRHGVG